MKRYEYENKYYNLGYDYIIGLDEAGRGPMAGELVVAGVIFPKGYYDERINDSKQLSNKKREELYGLIVENALAYDIEIVSVEDVDKLNVYQASKQAMEKCISNLMRDKMFALSDAMPLSYFNHEAIIKGDAKSYPEYGFDKHKGYVTKMHKEALEKYGPCPIHRKSFAPVVKAMQKQMSFDF